MIPAVSNASSPVGTRRALLALAGLALLPGGARAARARGLTPLRLMKVRHSTFLLDVGGVRVLVDPCFSRDLGWGPLLDVPPAALGPERVGRPALLLVTNGRSDHFDVRSLGELPGRDAWCFVPDDVVAKKLRHAGFSRVRVVQGGDRFEVGGVRVDVSPGADGLTARPAVGYRLSRRGRSVWHAGSPPPLDLAPAIVRWARAHQTEVALCCWDAWSTGDGRRLTMGSLDAQLLAALARARTVVATCDDVRPSLPGSLLLAREPGRARREIAGGPRVVVAERGVWYRVAARRRRR
jgi:L-ascorbate metabolism protein UlaG (beta-lactamase superfamily)